MKGGGETPYTVMTCETAVPNSVMPKGVEHSFAKAARCLQPWVPNSVMPKGVEHFNPLCFLIGRDLVPNSVMPKGVEHAPAARSGEVP